MAIYRFWRENMLSTVPAILMLFSLFVAEMTNSIAYKAMIEASATVTRDFVVNDFINDVWVKHHNTGDMFSDGLIDSDAEKSIQSQIHDFFALYDMVHMSLYKIDGKVIVTESNDGHAAAQAAFAQSEAMLEIFAQRKGKPKTTSILVNAVGDGVFVTNAVVLYSNGSHSKTDLSEPMAILALTYDYTNLAGIMRVICNSVMTGLLVAFSAVMVVSICDKYRVKAMAMKPLIAQQQKNAIMEKTMTELQNNAESKSRFFANFSHELRTPLNSIIGFSESMQRDNTLSVKQREYVSFINQAGQHLLELINDIIDYFRLEASSMEMKSVKLDIAKVVKLCVGMIKVQATQKNIVVNEVYSSDSVVVVADHKRLRQILLNLLSNAVKFTQDGGVIDVSITGTDEIVTISIKDSGIGVAASDLARIFTPFGRIENSNTKGAGLGLPLSRELTRAMGGDLKLQSEIGSGTTVALMFTCLEDNQ